MPVDADVELEQKANFDLDAMFDCFRPSVCAPIDIKAMYKQNSRLVDKHGCELVPIRAIDTCMQFVGFDVKISSGITSVRYSLNACSSYRMKE
jgi:hypothetical protein